MLLQYTNRKVWAIGILCLVAIIGYFTRNYRGETRVVQVDAEKCLAETRTKLDTLKKEYDSAIKTAEAELKALRDKYQRDEFTTSGDGVARLIKSDMGIGREQPTISIPATGWTPVGKVYVVSSPEAPKTELFR